MKIAFTGHRPPRLHGNEKNIGIWIYNTLNELMIENKIDAVYSGMAQGSDQIAAMKAILLDLPLYCAYPYPRNHFHPQEQFINERAAQIVTTSAEYTKDCFTKRDQYMVDHCDVLIAIWDGKPWGGTYDTIEYAKVEGKKIIYAPLDLFQSKDGG